MHPLTSNEVASGQIGMKLPSTRLLHSLSPHVWDCQWCMRHGLAMAGFTHTLCNWLVWISIMGYLPIQCILGMRPMGIHIVFSYRTLSQSPCTALMAGKLPAIRAVQGDCGIVYISTSTLEYQYVGSSNLPNKIFLLHTYTPFIKFDILCSMKLHISGWILWSIMVQNLVKINWCFSLNSGPSFYLPG